MEKKWKLFEAQDCPICGGAIEVLSEIPADVPEFYDGEDARCFDQCGFISCVSVEYGDARIQDGNEHELNNNN